MSRNHDKHTSALNQQSSARTQMNSSLNGGIRSLKARMAVQVASPSDGYTLSQSQSGLALHSATLGPAEFQGKPRQLRGPKNRELNQILSKTKTNNVNLYLNGGQFGRPLSHRFRITSANTASSRRSASKQKKQANKRITSARNHPNKALKEPVPSESPMKMAETLNDGQGPRHMGGNIEEQRTWSSNRDGEAMAAQNPP